MRTMRQANLSGCSASRRATCRKCGVRILLLGLYCLVLVYLRGTNAWRLSCQSLSGRTRILRTGAGGFAVGTI
jgi:hypothetical protein